MRTTLLALSPLLLAAACGTSSPPAATLSDPTSPPGTSTPAAAAPAAAPAAASTAPCRTSGLRVRLGNREGTAGSFYAPIVLTNTGSSSCTLRGYPGVSYVAPNSGQRVGAAATHNTRYAVTTVTLTAGRSASAILQLIDIGSFPRSRCAPATVSGLRVYPPGSSAAAYVAFSAPAKACSTQVTDLTVQAVR